MASLTDFADSSMNFELRAWVADAGKMASVASALRLHIWDMFSVRQFEMPYPKRDVHLVSGLAGAAVTVTED